MGLSSRKIHAFSPVKPAQYDLHHAQNNLAALYLDGIGGIQKDYDKAVALLEKAAAQDYAQAQINLAIAYINGLGVAKDFTKARAWLEKAITNSNGEIKEYAENILQRLNALDKAPAQ